MAGSDAASFVKRLQKAEFDVRLAEGELDSDVVGYISTQAANLDIVLGHPGIPQGRLTTITGPYGGGKSTIAIHLLAETQHRDGIAVLIDAERTYAKDRAERMGIDHSKLVYTEGTTVEGTFKLIDGMIDDVHKESPGRLVTIVWDTISGSPTEAQLEGQFRPGDHARAVTTWMRIIHPKIAKHRLTLVIVNQLSEAMDIGGSPWLRRRRGPTMIAGNRLRYWSSIVLECSQVSKIGEAKAPDGILIKAYTDKNKVARPFRTTLVPIDFLHGIDRVACILDAAENADPPVVEKNGSWYQYAGQKFQAPKWPKVLEEHPEIREKVVAATTSWQAKAGG